MGRRGEMDYIKGGGLVGVGGRATGRRAYEAAEAAI